MVGPQKQSSQHAIDRAIEHYRAGRLAHAKEICRNIIAADPGDGEALHLLGIIAHRSDNSEDAVKLLEKAIRLKGPHPPPSFLNNLAEAYRAIGDPSKAETCYREALALDPNFTEAHNNLGNALLALRRLDEAEHCYRKAMELDPQFPLAILNYSLLQLLRGHYAKGFALYERRFEAGDARHIGAARSILGQLDGIPRWRGERLKSATVLVWTEQGLGDSLMMARYLTKVKDRVGRLVVYCEPALGRLMQTVDGVDDVYSGASIPPRTEFQCHCPIMSLPLIFETRVQTIPSRIPYFVMPNEVRQRWRDMLATLATPRVGLVWAGGQRTRAESSRSIRLTTFSPLMEVSNTQFISLQKGAASKQLDEINAPIVDLMYQCSDLFDTAALIEQLDLVISVDTAVAHLAGALGKPIWLLNPFRGAWQWMMDREDSPWYPTMRIFRETVPGSWDAVIGEVAAALRAEWKPSDSVRTHTTPEMAPRNGERVMWQRWLRRIIGLGDT